MKILVTGGTGGIGRAIVENLARNGHYVTVFFNKDEHTAKELRESLGVECFGFDLSKSEGIEQACKFIQQGKTCDCDKTRGVDCSCVTANNGFDAFIHVAGISRMSLFQDETGESIQGMMNVNLVSAMHLTRVVLPAMISKKFGKIIFVSSIWGSRGASMEVAYSTTKAGLEGFGKALAKEVGLSGVTVNVVAPGCIDTKMLQCFDCDTLKGLVSSTSVGRLGQTRDVSGAVEFFLSEKASFITGQVLEVSGGFIG